MKNCSHFIVEHVVSLFKAFLLSVFVICFSVVCLLLCSCFIIFRRYKEFEKSGDLFAVLRYLYKVGVRAQWSVPVAAASLSSAYSGFPSSRDEQSSVWRGDNIHYAEARFHKPLIMTDHTFSSTQHQEEDEDQGGRRGGAWSNYTK